MSNSIILSVGDSYHLRIGKDRIVYAGMPTDKTFSIVQKKWEFLYRGYAWNLFFPVEQKKIRIDGVNIIVEHVTREEIRLQM